MWVKLKVSKVIKREHKKIGDWVEVGTDTALQWIANGHAESLDLEGALGDKDIGIVYPPSARAPKLSFKNIRLFEGGIYPQFPRSLFLNAPYSILDRDCPELLRNIGKLSFVFELLKKWDVVLILASYETNASKIAGTEAPITESIVHDLRVPYFQNCAFAVADNGAGKAFCAAYSEELAFGRRLASLRALYRIKPLTYYLPPSFGRDETKGRV